MVVYKQYPAMSWWCNELALLPIGKEALLKPKNVYSLKGKWSCLSIEAADPLRAPHIAQPLSWGLFRTAVTQRIVFFLSLNYYFTPLGGLSTCFARVCCKPCRAFAVYFFNKPPRTLFRVASTRNFYMVLLLLTTFLCALPVGYAVVQITPSISCGPFRWAGPASQLTRW